jgi:Flp pilus assembly protein TadB
MFWRGPMFIRLQGYGQRFANNPFGAAWWLLMAPGVGCIAVALAILLWPELLAYMVASVLLFIGITLVAWSWRIRRVERQVQQQISRL